MNLNGGCIQCPITYSIKDLTRHLVDTVSKMSTYTEHKCIVADFSMPFICAAIFLLELQELELQVRTRLFRVVLKD